MQKNVYLFQAEKKIEKAERLSIILYPILQEKKFLLNAVKELAQALILLKKFRENPFYKKIFYRQKRILSPEEKNLIKEIFEIAKEYSQSTMDFKRKEEVIILSENSETTKVSPAKIHLYIQTAKKILKAEK